MSLSAIRATWWNRPPWCCSSWCRYSTISVLSDEPYRPIYDLNPIAATVISLRKIVYEAQPPVGATLWKLVGASLTVFLLGLVVFRRLKPMFYEHI